MRKRLDNSRSVIKSQILYDIICQSKVSNVQIQCTIAFDAQTEGKVSAQIMIVTQQSVS